MWLCVCLFAFGFACGIVFVFGRVFFVFWCSNMVMCATIEGCSLVFVCFCCVCVFVCVVCDVVFVLGCLMYNTFLFV